MAIQSPSRGASGRPDDLAGFGPESRRVVKIDDPTDYEHRHFVNLAAAAFLLCIAIAIIWTVKAMEDYENLQKCLGSGRRECVDLHVPVRPMIPVPARKG